MKHFALRSTERTRILCCAKRPDRSIGVPISKRPCGNLDRFQASWERWQRASCGPSALLPIQRTGCIPRIPIVSAPEHQPLGLRQFTGPSDVMIPYPLQKTDNFNSAKGKRFPVSKVYSAFKRAAVCCIFVWH